MAIESSDDGMSEYSRDEDYTSLVSVPPASDETIGPAEIEEATAAPAALDPPSTATLLPSSSNYSRFSRPFNSFPAETASPLSACPSFFSF